MRSWAVVFAIFVSALGCAHRDPSAPAWEARVIRPREATAKKKKRAPAPPKVFTGPDAWWHRAIAEREARIEALREEVDAADDREDAAEKERLEGKLDFEKQSLHEFRQVSTERYSLPMFVGGMALSIVGGGALIANIIVLVAARPGPESSSTNDLKAATRVLVPVCLGGAAIGLPLLFVGVRKVPKSHDSARVWVGPRELSVRGSF